MSRTSTAVACCSKEPDPGQRERWKERRTTRTARDEEEDGADEIDDEGEDEEHPDAIEREDGRLVRLWDLVLDAVEEEREGPRWPVVAAAAGGHARVSVRRSVRKVGRSALLADVLLLCREGGFACLQGTSRVSVEVRAGRVRVSSRETERVYALPVRARGAGGPRGGPGHCRLRVRMRLRRPTAGWARRRSLRAGERRGRPALPGLQTGSARGGEHSEMR